jgi:hypothetical protein
MLWWAAAWRERACERSKDYCRPKCESARSLPPLSPHALLRWMPCWGACCELHVRVYVHQTPSPLRYGPD